MFLSQFSIVTAQDVVAVNFTIFPPLRTIAIIDAFEGILFPSVLNFRYKSLAVTCLTTDTFQIIFIHFLSA